MSQFIAVANIDNGGHYITTHEINDLNFECNAIFRNWVFEMSGEIGFTEENDRILAQETITPIEGMLNVGRASFCFGNDNSHCIVVFIGIKRE